MYIAVRNFQSDFNMIEQDIIAQVQSELNKAQAKFPEFHSMHEGYAVIKEELDEVWD